MKLFKITFLIIITGTAVYSESTRYAQGKVDWIKGTVTSVERSALNIDDKGDAIDEETGQKISLSSSRDISYEKAKERALAGAVNAINDIQVDPESTIRDLVIRDRETRQKITHYIHEYSRFREKPAGCLNTSCELELRLSYLINVLGVAFPEDDFPLRDDVEISTKYTSLIVDTRGLKIRPMLLPSIMNETGLEVYSRNNISGQVAVKHLAVSYTFSETEAMKHKKAGPRPFYCIALKSLNGNPVISDEDIKRVFSHKENLAFLKKCRVIFIIER